VTVLEKTYKYNVLICLVFNEATHEQHKEVFEYPYSVKDTPQRLKTRITRELRARSADLNLAGVLERRVRYDLYEMPNEYFRTHSSLIWSKELSYEEVMKIEDRKVHTKIPVERPSDEDRDQPGELPEIL
jgi:hypothetical protein